jgi:16S rRNA (cytidine1402-2'-O)-methyltransferase
MNPSKGTLYVVATPIGNLADITYRAVDTLRKVDFVICENSRHSGILLTHFEIKKPFRVVNDHTSKSRQEALIGELENGSSAALISDAGTPLISDPGFPLVREALRLGIRVEGVPGPAAFTNALVTSGLPVNEFTFVGYLPQKEKKRRDKLAVLETEPRTLIFYESPYRIEKSLKDVLDMLGDREIYVTREMTKKFEEMFRGPVSEVLEAIKKRKILGEFTVVVAGSVKRTHAGQRLPFSSFPSPSGRGLG